MVLRGQKDIVEYLDSECSKIDKQVSDLNRQVELLKEINNRIISDAISGKIDVRGIEIPEYEFVDEDTGADSDSDDDSDETEEQED